VTGFSVGDARELAQLLRAAGRAEVMPRFRRLAPGAIRQKSGPLDLVTEADEAAEAMISAGLTRMFPGCRVVGEEAVAADRSLLGQIGGPGLCFVVDPIDGTANFAAGLPLFGIMAAAVQDGEIVGAVIHDPVGDDCAMAVRGEGAWTEMPDGTTTDLKVAPPGPPETMAGVAAWRFMPEPRRATVLRNLPNVAGSWDYRCAAHSYRLIAGGHCHYLLFNRLLPWDHAPGWLLHREAGGWSARLDGSPYTPTETTGGLLCTPTQDSWTALRETLLNE
jgi:fructose-1,6-bisphosphatase/inositol monophosphatase family enzyme